MKFDHEVIKDAIYESDTSVKRKDIIFENVYGPQNGYIMALYMVLIWSNKFSLSVDEYELRLKEKLREDKLCELVIEKRGF